MSKSYNQQPSEFNLDIEHVPSLEEKAAHVFDGLPDEARTLYIDAERDRRKEKYLRLQQAFMHEVEIPESNATKAALEKNSRTDGLTGLLNRSAFEEVYEGLAHLRQREGHESNDHFLLIDLDGFKGVNDKFGHPAGDKLLQEVAKRINSSVRTEDVVARFGGDEFAVLLVDPSQPDSESSMAIAERILGAVKEGSDSLDSRYGVTASIGIGNVASERQFDEVYSHVDASLYHAKQAGKARIVQLPPESEN